MYTLARIGLFVASFLVIEGIWNSLVAGSANPCWCRCCSRPSSRPSRPTTCSPARGTRFAARVDARASTIARRFEQSRAKEDQD